ncbi:MAG: DUF3343 domain-containing protein [Thermotaleaceae bacterium]
MGYEEFYVIAFESTHHAMQTEKYLKTKFSIETIPTPREISASCGLSIKFSRDIFADVTDMLKKENRGYHVFRVERKEGKRQIIKIT